MKWAKARSLCTLLTILFGPVTASNAAITLTINYYTVAGTDRDANRLSHGNFSNEVQAGLGPNGLPVLNTTTFGCTTNCFPIGGEPLDVTSGGEITYWSPTLNNGGAGGTSDVTFTGSGTVTLPFDVPTNFFPPNGTGTDNLQGFQAVTLSGTLIVPVAEALNFTLGADDMAFVYLDGQVVCDLGGIHRLSAGACGTQFAVPAGTHDLQVFYADMFSGQAGLSFDVTTSDVTTAIDVPEPTTITMFAAAVMGLVLSRYRNMTPLYH